MCIPRPHLLLLFFSHFSSVPALRPIVVADLRLLANLVVELRAFRALRMQMGTLGVNVTPLVVDPRRFDSAAGAGDVRSRRIASRWCCIPARELHSSPRLPPAHPARLLSWFLDSPAAPFRASGQGARQGRRHIGDYENPRRCLPRLRPGRFPRHRRHVLLDEGVRRLAYTRRVSSAHASSSYASHNAHPSSSSHHSHVSHRELHVRTGGDKSPATKKQWGDRPGYHQGGFLVLLPPHTSRYQMLYTFPQSVDVAGRRPSSSCYFVGMQGDGLFYLDPHHSRPTAPAACTVGGVLVLCIVCLSDHSSSKYLSGVVWEERSN
ncbi:hypothetical protein C8J57DRAFT_1620326 [Mycena rebaudengoi]|nr:hypothetical protein C8J57DRAFT_1620326 [Mycena rebaudengoi]